MPTPSSSHIVLATIGAPHGIRGEVRVKSFTADPMSLGDYGPLFASEGRAFEIERLRPLKGDMFVVKFRGVDDRNAAEALNGVELSVERSALPPAEAGEYYHADLIGLEAVDAEGKSLGRIVAVENFGAGDILEIAPPDGASLLVPFTNATVPDIDIAGGRLTILPPAEIEIKEEET
jgi:16S rRNA processing protein RimM